MLTHSQVEQATVLVKKFQHLHFKSKDYHYAVRWLPTEQLPPELEQQLIAMELEIQSVGSQLEELSSNSEIDELSIQQALNQALTDCQKPGFNWQFDVFRFRQ